MNEYLPSESASITIGVCGEQAAGKTVFLTCIFQSIRKHIPSGLLLEFDRKAIGNASYYQGVENRLIGEGTTTGTTDQTLYPVRLHLKPYKPLPGKPPTVLTVDLLDFAGGHFTSIADLKNLDESADASDSHKTLQTVNETLERADAFVVLVNSKEIDPINPSPSRNPFGPSVEFVLTHCRAEGKPVALLFSQADQTPLLTEERFRALPRIHDFERDFTSDFNEAADDVRPFGIAKRVSCYETVEGDVLPRHLTGDGNIWLPEPAQVVLSLIQATVPRLNARFETAKAQAREEQERAARKSRETIQRLRIVAIAVLITLILVVAFSMWARRQASQRQDVTFIRGVEAEIRGGKLARISTDEETRLSQILTAGAADRGTSAVREAIRDLRSAAADATAKLAEAPALDRAYGGEISRLQTLAPLFDPQSAVFRRTLLPLLEARETFLATWFGDERKERRSRTALLDQSAQQFRKAGDTAFSGVLATQSRREKETEIATWQGRIDADADVPARLVTMQNLLVSAVGENDPEFAQMARNFLASALIETILKRHENAFVREKLLTPLAPDLAQFSDGDVRFEVLSRNLLGCTTHDECAGRQQIVDAVDLDAEKAAAGWGSGIDNLLRSLLLDLPAEQRRQVWTTFAASLESSYLFSSRSDAWPQDMAPLHVWIRARVNAADDPTLDLVERISHHPIYTAELHYLRDRLTALEAERKVVGIYTNVLAALAQRSTSLSTDELTAVGQQILSVAGSRDDVGAPLARMGDEIGQVLLLIRSANNFWAAKPRTLFAVPPTAARLERLLRDARKEHCTALAAHDAPTECSNAA